MRRRAAVLVSLLLFAAGAVIVFQPRWAAAAEHDVTVADFSFTDAVSSSSTTTITAGESVTWTWSGGDIHSVTADDGSFDSDPPPANWRSSGSFSKTFSTPGTYAYYCRVHGGAGSNGMSGTIVVEAAANTSTSTAIAVTDTPQPTSTPRTPTATPEATHTPDPGATATPSLSPEARVDTAAGPAAPGPVVAVDAAVRLPSTGSGPGGSAATIWAAIAVATLMTGFACIALTRDRNGP